MGAEGMWRAIERAKKVGTYKEPKEPVLTPEQKAWEKRRSKAEAQLRCLYDKCEYFFDCLPALCCTVTGKSLCLMSMPDIEEIVEHCPYSGANCENWNKHLLTGEIAAKKQ
jgi:hypothetical protein